MTTYNNIDIFKKDISNKKIIYGNWIDGKWDTNTYTGKFEYKTKDDSTYIFEGIWTGAWSENDKKYDGVFEGNVCINNKNKHPYNFKGIWIGKNDKKFFEGKVIKYNINDIIDIKNLHIEILNKFNDFKDGKKKIITQCFNYATYYLFDGKINNDLINNNLINNDLINNNLINNDLINKTNNFDKEFDRKLDRGEYIKLLDFIGKDLKCNDIFNLQQENIIHIESELLLYKFIYKDQNYIYLSNLNLDNDNIDNKNNSSEIFWTSNPDISNNLLNFISTINKLSEDIQNNIGYDLLKREDNKNDDDAQYLLCMLYDASDLNEIDQIIKNNDKHSKDFKEKKLNCVNQKAVIFFFILYIKFIKLYHTFNINELRRFIDHHMAYTSNIKTDYLKILAHIHTYMQSNQNLLHNIITDKNYLSTLYVGIFKYMVSILQKNIRQCNFGYVITGKPDETYNSKILEIYNYKKIIDENDDLYDQSDENIIIMQFISFINNCYNGHNKKIYNDIYSNDNSNLPIDDNKFNKFVDNIYNSIKNIDSSYTTILYKSQKTLPYINNYGFFNKIPQSILSSNFYNYYNLGIFISLLDTYADNNENEFIIKYVKFHYNMIHLLCYSSCTNKISNNVTIYNQKKIYGHIFVDILINKNNLLKEIIELYKDSTNFEYLYYNPKKKFIDYLLDYPLIIPEIAKDLKNSILVEKVYNPYKALFIFLDESIHYIRTSNDLSNERNININIFAKMHSLFTEMNKQYYKLYTKNSNIYNILKKFYIIYINLLIEIYRDSTKKKRLFNNANINNINIILLYCDELVERISNDKKILNFNVNAKIDYQDRDENILFENNIMYDFFISRLNLNEIHNISLFIIEKNKKKEEKENLNNYIINIFKQEQFKYTAGLTFYLIKYKKYYGIDTKQNELKINNYDYFEVYFTSFEILNNYSPYININKNEDFVIYIDILFFKYLKCFQIINNRYINETIKDRYNSIIKNLKQTIIKYFIKIMNEYNIKNIITKDIFNKFIIIITNGEYMFMDINNNIDDIEITDEYKSYASYLRFFSFLQKDTKVYKYNTIDITNETLYNFKIILNKLNNNNLSILNNSEFIEEIINCLNTYIIIKNNVIEEFIKKLISIDNGLQLFKYNKAEQNSNNFELILFRFGIDVGNIHKYIFLLNKTISKNTFNYFYVIVEDLNKCIKIAYDKNYKIVLMQCTIIDINDDKEKSLLPYDGVQKLPFFNIIPSYSPYLLYKNNEEYALEIILSLKKFKTLYYYYELNINFEILVIKISPSTIFPNIESLNFLNYKKLYEIYNIDIKKIKKNILKTKYNFKFKNDVFSNLIDSINNDLNTNIKYTEQNIDNFELFNSLTITEKEKEMFKNFTNENKIFKINDKKINIDQYFTKLKDIKNLILEKISDDFDIFINKVIDLNDFILLIEIDMIEKALSLIIKEKNSWDINYILTTIKDILYFNNSINKGIYYYFEILFLLQNNYIYKEYQIKKYLEIRGELIESNNELKIHQFMMGKGKTSVFTPLLSFCVNIITAKTATIITINHLVKQTKQYIDFMVYIMDIGNINVYSDFTAKKRWLENTDIELKKSKINIGNEINIIDEFDYQHNYLQSIFNYVIDNIKINYELFQYVYYFTDNKISGKNNNNNDSVILNPVYDTTNKTADNDKYVQYFDLNKLNIILNNIYETTKNMKNNEHYGLSFLHLEEEKDIIFRICTPFSRRDTPVKNSNFSNVLLTLILTFKLYIEQYKKKIQDFDFKNLCNNKFIITELISEFEDIDDSTKYKLFNECDEELVEIIKNIFVDVYDKKNDAVNNNILLKYLYHVNITKINFVSKQKNISFQDIIYNNYKDQWQVGYSGTTSLKLNNYKPGEKFVFKEIKYDFDEKIEVLLALSKYGETDNNRCFIKILDKKENDFSYYNTNIINKISDKENGLIDLYGIFNT